MKAKLNLANLERVAAAGYEIERDGTIYSNLNWRGYGRRALTPIPNSDGYPRVKLKLNGEMKFCFVHKLVVQKFIGSKPTPEHEICHKNGIKTDNSAENLYWGTKKENARDRSLHGNTAAGPKNGNFKTHCKNGHDLSIHGRVRKDGGRACRPCHNIRRRLS